MNELHEVVDTVLDLAELIVEDIESQINVVAAKESKLLGMVESTELLSVLLVNAVQAKLANRYAEVPGVSLDELPEDTEVWENLKAEYSDVDG